MQSFQAPSSVTLFPLGKTNRKMIPVLKKKIRTHPPITIIGSINHDSDVRLPRNSSGTWESEKRSVRCCSVRRGVFHRSSNPERLIQDSVHRNRIVSCDDPHGIRLWSLSFQNHLFSCEPSVRQSAMGALQNKKNFQETQKENARHP